MIGIHLTLWFCILFRWLQYTARFNAEAVKNFLYTLNDGKISKKKFNSKLNNS